MSEMCTIQHDKEPALGALMWKVVERLAGWTKTRARNSDQTVMETVDWSRALRAEIQDTSSYPERWSGILGCATCAPRTVSPSIAVESGFDLDLSGQEHAPRNQIRFAAADVRRPIIAKKPFPQQCGN